MNKVSEWAKNKIGPVIGKTATEIFNSTAHTKEDLAV